MAETTTPLPSGQTFKDFQTSASDKDKRNIEYGKIVARHIVNTAYGTDNSGYIGARNVRFAKNRALSGATVDIYAMFADKMGLNNKRNFVNINWKALTIVNTVVSRIVGRWMNRNEKIVVTATDTLSITQKNDQYKEIQFELDHRKMIQELEAATGVSVVPKDQFRPADQEELELWRKELQKLPEEILYQTNCNDAFSANGWDDVLKEQALTDSAEVGFVGTYTWMDEQGVIHVDRVTPENAFYSYSQYADFRDTTWRGQALSLKITELRRRYGKQFNPNKKDALTEQQIAAIAATSTNNQLSDKLSWVGEWEFAAWRPYDDYTVEIADFEVKTVDVEGYSVTKLKNYGTTLIEQGEGKYKGDEPFVKSKEYVEDKNWCIYRGVYAIRAQEMLEWGLKKNMIRPQDPKEMGNCEFSYSFYMYQPKNMRNVAIPEKLEAPFEQLVLTCLQMEKCIATMRPVGAAIDVDAIQELALGLGKTAEEKSSPEEVGRIYDTTGKLYYRGRDAAGNKLGVPITELQNTGFLGQMQGLIQMYQFYWGVLRDQLGEDPNLISQAATPRVSQGNIQAAQQMGEFATDYMYYAYIRCMEETAKKMACLMHTSVRYGAKAYRDIMGKETVKDRVFGTKIRMLPTAVEIQYLRDLLNQAIASQPDFVLYVDTFKILRIAQEDVKLAEEYYRNAMKNMRIAQQEQASRQAQENGQIQQQAAQATAQAKAEVEQLKGQMKLQQDLANSQVANRQTVIAGTYELYKLAMQTGKPLPPELREISRITLETVALPALIENKETQDAVKQKMMADIQADEEARQQEDMIQGQQAPPLPSEQPTEMEQPEMMQ